MARPRTHVSGVGIVIAVAALSLMSFVSASVVTPMTLASPKLTTALSATSISAGGSVYDTAVLTGFIGSGSTPGGSASYYVYLGNGTCSSAGGAPTLVGTVTVSVAGAVPNSPAYTFNTPGPESWDATYSGNANNNPASSPCEVMNVTAAMDTISTNLSASTISMGGTVHDNATLSGATATAGGTVTYELFPNGNCSGNFTIVSTVMVTGGSVPSSVPRTFNTPGAYSWRAVYSGDANNSAATSACEPMDVTRTSPAITTILSSSTVTEGGSVHDSATLAGATSNAGGTVTYYWSGTCPPSASHVIGTVTVASAIVPNSPSIIFNFGTGYFYLYAVYSGDGNNTGAQSACEQLLVQSAPPTITTDLNVTANVSSGNLTYPTFVANTEPCAMAYNTAFQYLYITLFGSNKVQVMDLSVGISTIAGIPVGQGPCALTYDSNNHDIYVANTDFLNGGGSVSVISGVTVVATVSLPGTVPEGVAFNPLNDEIYVGSYGSPVVTLICDGGTPCGGSPQMNHVVGTVNLGSSRPAIFGGLVADPVNGRVFVPVQDSNTGKYYVAVISGNSVLTSIQVPVMLGSDNGVFDPVNGDIYLSNDWLFTATVVVLSGTADTYVGAVHLVHPGGGTAGDVSVDPTTGEVFASQPFGDLNILSGTSVLNHLPYPADSVAYTPPSGGELFLGYYRGPTSDILVLDPGYVATDSAQLAGTTPGAGGTVSYEYFAGNSCSGYPTMVSTVPFSGNPVAKSTPHFFPSESYSYVAVYSGDVNNRPATSPCEPFVPPVIHDFGPPIHVSFASFSAYGPTQLLVVDPSGERTGFLANGTATKGAPGAIVGGPSPYLESVSLPNASLSGEYTVTVTGTSSASSSGSNYTLLVDAETANATDTLNATYRGATIPGEVLTFHVTVGASGVAIELVSTSGGPETKGSPWYGTPTFALALGVAAIAAAAAAAVSLIRHPPKKTKP